MNKADLLKKSLDAVTSRGEKYGDTKTNFQNIANFWSLHLSSTHKQKIILTPEDVAAMMILMKLARLAHSSDHLDGLIDISGYAACWADLSHKPAVAIARPEIIK